MKVFLNGKIIAAGDAKISPLDRSFLFGDGAYEVVPFFNRKPFEMLAHLERLQKTLDGIALANPYNINEWQKIINEVVATSETADLALYLQVSRGEYEKRDHVFPAITTPTVFIAPFAMSRPTAKMLSEGAEVITTEDKRWFFCNYKTTSLLGNVLARNLSAQAGAIETLLFRDGYLSEGSATNAFVVKNGEILIVPDTHLILKGITYSVVEKLVHKNKLPFQKRPVSKDEVFNADEIWLTSSTKMVLPITKIDGKAVGNGKVGEVFKKTNQLIWEYQAKS